MPRNYIAYRGVPNIPSPFSDSPLKKREHIIRTVAVFYLRWHRGGPRRLRHCGYARRYNNSPAVYMTGDSSTTRYFLYAKMGAFCFCIRTCRACLCRAVSAVVVLHLRNIGAGGCRLRGFEYSLLAGGFWHLFTKFFALDG